MNSAATAATMPTKTNAGDHVAAQLAQGDARVARPRVSPMKDARRGSLGGRAEMEMSPSDRMTVRIIGPRIGAPNMRLRSAPFQAISAAAAMMNQVQRGSVAAGAADRGCRGAFVKGGQQKGRDHTMIITRVAWISGQRAGVAARLLPKERTMLLPAAPGMGGYQR